MAVCIPQQCPRVERGAYVQDVLHVGADVSVPLAGVGAEDARDVGPHRALAGCQQAQQQVPPSYICHHLPAAPKSISSCHLDRESSDQRNNCCCLDTKAQATKIVISRSLLAFAGTNGSASCMLKITACSG